MTQPYEKFVLLTGGPGAGKSTLIDALSRRGYATYPEAGRSIIREQVRIGGPALPWGDTALYAEISLTWDIRSYREAERDRPDIAFFDRGLPDHGGVPGGRPAAHVDAAIRAFPYARRAFLAEPWPEIFIQDTERKQTFPESQRICADIEKGYRDYGYELIPLPFTSVEERVEFVLEHALR